MYYRRKIDEYLNGWKADPEHKPLIVKGARQIGKTESIMHFAGENYENVVYINFALEKKYMQILADGYDVESVLKNISLANPAFSLIAVLLIPCVYEKNSMFEPLFFSSCHTSFQ